MRFLYLGQTSMANRGCEALIRSNTMLIREKFPQATFLCPSVDRALDEAQWPEAVSQGVEFVDVMPYSQSLLWWNRFRRVVPGFEKLVPPPRYPLGRQYRELLDRCDAVLMTGGDIISLDYEVFSLYHWSGLVDAAVAAGKPAHLLAASVGPFTRRPDVEARMRTHLAGYRSISVRETPTLKYLGQIGVEGVQLVADPAFTLIPQAWDDSAYFSPETEYLGFNVSPLVRQTRGSEASKLEFDEEVVRFIADVIAQTPLHVRLISHVDPLTDSDFNSDFAYMAGLLKRLPDTGRVALLPKSLNATQIKAAIGKCRYFMGARTHATVGSLSQFVPTCSIAYSVKALGINEDLLGDTRFVLPTPEVSYTTLWKHLRLLMAEEASIRSLLEARIPEWKMKARAGMDMIANH